MLQSNIVENLKKIKETIYNTCVRCGRDPEEIMLVAVSKLHPSEKIRKLYKAGHLDFGENYVQEAMKKQKKLEDLKEIRWHFIGRIQTNKAKFIVGNFWLVHSVDSLKVAQALNKRASLQKITQLVLIQVNIGEEKQKGGIKKEETIKLAEEILKLENLKLKGLMCLPPYFEDPEKVRPFFKQMRYLKEEIERALNIRLPYLSMGMSSDFVQAIEEGANILRIGTSIFGERPSKN